MILPVLTLILFHAPDSSGSMIVRGISQDETLFDDVTFTTPDEFARYAAKHWRGRYVLRTVWSSKEYVR